MGMYTNLFGDIALSPLGVRVITALNAEAAKPDEGARMFPHVWAAAMKAVPESQHFIEPWLKVERCNLIPLGSYADEDAFSRLEGNVWSFSCWLKNYGSEIEAFLLRVLPYMIDEPANASVQYEEWPEPELYSVSPLQVECLEILESKVT